VLAVTGERVADVHHGAPILLTHSLTHCSTHSRVVWSGGSSCGQVIVCVQSAVGSAVQWCVKENEDETE
jgi:hypothetical protein